MAQAAIAGGAVGIRANGVDDIAAIATVTDEPIIALNKVAYPDSDVRITPTRNDAEALLGAGATIVAIDATSRRRPNGETLQALVGFLRDAGAFILADIDSEENGIRARDLGAHAVATTLSGYTASRPTQDGGPDIALVRRLTGRLDDLPVVAEGRFRTAHEVSTAIQAGAHAVVVGTAITAPDAITRPLADAAAAALGEK